MADRKPAIENIFGAEGVFANSPYDKGKKTKYGITEIEMRLNGWWGKPEDFPKDLAQKIYEKKYWDKLNLDMLKDQGLAEMIFDGGVNMGTGTVGKFVQRAANVLNRNQRSWLDLLIDGLIGKQTAAIINILGKQDMAFLKFGILCLRGADYWRIADGSDQEMNIRSWLRRMASEDLIEVIKTLLKGK